MTKYQKRHRIIATFFLLIFFPTIFPSDLFASNNGPVAPEATSFEPIDATDMVNLTTGDMSYVLPLLNVPSPEGGYPLTLSNHAGIAMDEEASWVGLGWSLNPGAINRSVKGVPDDWDKTRISELLYDQGQTLDYYDFSIGGTLPNGITIGMSRSWGAHKAWGGTVGYAGVGIGVGSEEINVSYAGVGVGYDLNSKKISGSYTLSATGAFNNGLTINTNGEVKASALGISYNTASNKVTSQFLNVSSSNSTSVTKSDYFINNYNRGFDLNLAGFYWVAYQHTHIEYSLFKLTNNYTSGTLNLFDSKKESQYKQDIKYSMDVRSHNVKDKNRPSSQGVGVFTAAEITLPDYDNYFATAQGMSGSFSPRIYDEIMLYGKGNEANNLTYLTYPASINDSNYKLNNKLFFYFDNVNSSFLRTQTGDFKSLDSEFDLDNNVVNSNGGNESARFANNIVTDTDNTFSYQYYKATGQLKKVGNRKRDGQYIEAFTNKDIVDGNTGQTPFIEASDYDRIYYKNIAENGIGAYRITALDGKVYHYSLPVYSYEEVYKNYSNVNNENDKFLETIKTKPYATHWLLTAITGPDYVDINNNRIIDNDDYGYYVQFEYGKWSDGYGWRSPKVGGKTYNNKNFIFWGRKQIYYLDKIKTRTHTALFVKSVREDDKSTSIQYRNGQYQSGPMSENITQSFQDRVEKPIEPGYYYKLLPNSSTIYESTNLSASDNKHRSYKYVDLPENLSLKLDKIILLKNSDAININKNLGTGTNRKKGYVYFDFGFQGISDVFRKNPYDVKIADINTDQTVLDTEDIRILNQSQGFDIQTKAVKVINFNYDYSLGSNLPNANNGRLALRSLELNGKNNIKTMPVYRFNYSKNTVPYNFTNSDNWGYVKDNPDAWSLNEIITPNGAKMKIDYEPDSFSREAAFNTNTVRNSAEAFYRVHEPRYNIPVKYTIQDNTITLNTTFVSSGSGNNLNDIFNLNQEVNLSFQFKDPNPIHSPSSPGNIELLNNYTIVGINDTNKTLTLKPNDKTDIALQKRFFEGPYCSIIRGNGGFETYVYNYSESNAAQYAYSFRVIANYNVLIGTYGRNGKNGGGLRVKRITTSDFNNENTLFTDYDYRNPYTTNISGVTSFEPSDNPQVADQIQAVEEIPSPNVQYEYVTATVKNSSETLSSSLFNFKVMDDLTLSNPNEGEYEYKFGDQFSIKFYGGSRRKLDSNFSLVSTSKIILYDNFSSLGQLLSVKHFNSKHQLISQTINKYKKFQNDDIESGISQESFKYAIQEYTNRNIINVKDYRYTFNSIGKVFFPSRLESTTTTKGGWSTTNYYDNYDFLTGQATETRTINSNGEVTKTKITPAYLRYGSMGSKVDNPNVNKNMLSQIAVNYSYIKNNSVSKPWKETGVGITTWNNVWSYKDIAGTTVPATALNEKIWRKHKSYTWNGEIDSNGVFKDYISGNDYDTDDDFKWNSPVDVAQSTKWKQLSEITLYDHFSAPLEAKDINGNYASTKMGDNDTKVMVSGNAGYNEMFFAGGENEKGLSGTNWLEPGISSTGENVIWNTVNPYPHTGKKTIKVTPATQFGATMKSGQHRAGKYKVTVWIPTWNNNQATLKVNGNITSFTQSNTAGGWILKTAYVDVPSGDCSIFLTSNSGTVYFDDLMIRPISSSITGYVYNEWDELTAIIGNNGLGTKFTYDAAGRLIMTETEVIDDSVNGVSGGFKITRTNILNNKYL
ncbi:RHS repeat protein [Flavobacterium sp. CF136]|uniref:RHS repeat protein n=1 Tax=Flavobacterium sp. (strain CF136) TaxID=1144313 RepID=UPI000271744D|nr:RHS repeat protein [Flavobacterium sp. CF136]EJL60663.1 hypothetical protein PMI10_03721 [Flavobacterium sp. CF136]